MRKKASRVLALLAILGWALLSAPAGALSGMSVGVCVSDTQFEFDVTVNDVESELLLIELLNVSAGHIQWISTTIAVNQGTGDVSFSVAPHITESNVAARDTFSLPFSDLGLSSVAGSVGWDVQLTGAVAHGSEPFTPGENLGSAFARDHTEPFSDWRIFSVPIADCDGPPVTTTQPPVTTTQPPVSTTEPPVTTTQPPVTTTQPPVTTTQPPVTTTEPPVTTTSPPQATTTTLDVSSSSTLPETGVGSLVRGAAPTGLVLLLVGSVALGTAALIGSRRRVD